MTSIVLRNFPQSQDVGMAQGEYAMYTEKIIFNGTPAQFVAVADEYGIDTFVGGDRVDNYVTSPRKITILPGERIHDTKHDIKRFTPRVVTEFTIGNGKRFTVTALVRPDKKTQLTLRVKDDERENIKEAWEKLVSYMASMGWVQGVESLPEPEKWLEALRSKGITIESDEGKETISRWVKQYWTEKGKSSLSVRERLSKCLGVSKTWIYDNLSLNDT